MTRHAKAKAEEFWRSLFLSPTGKVQKDKVEEEFWYLVKFNRYLESVTNGTFSSLELIDPTKKFGPSNLRIITNRSVIGYSGVSFDKIAKRYKVRIAHKGSLINLGYFKTPEDGALQYDLKVLELGLSKPLNFNEESRFLFECMQVGTV